MFEKIRLWTSIIRLAIDLTRQPRSPLNISNQEQKLLDSASPEVQDWMKKVIECRDMYFAKVHSTEVRARREACEYYEQRDRLHAEIARLRKQLPAKGE